MSRDLAFMTVAELAPLIRDRLVSPVELVNAQLERIASCDDVLRAFIHLDADGARAQARAAEAEIVSGSYRGPLHGITVAHKDIIDVLGMPTTAASRVIEPRVAAEDSTVSARLKAAGAICLGKLNLVEFASGSMGVYGFARNPWNLSAFPGGSSSGSGAALAAGLSTLATGTDTGGSVRNPSCFCGLAGMRATYGRVSRHGCIPLSWSQDSIGPMGRGVADIAMMLEAIAGIDRRDHTSVGRPVPDFTAELNRGLEGIRIGIPDSFFLVDLDPEVDAAVHAAIRQLEALGAELKPVSLPAAEYGPAASWIIAYSESFVIHKPWFEAKAHDYTPAFYHKIAAAGLSSAEDRIVSQQLRQVVTREFLNAFRDVDVIATPTSRTLASQPSRAIAGRRNLPWGAEMTSLTRPISLTGFPSLSVPIGFARDNTPMGMQLISRPWEEAIALRTAHAYEQSTSWHQARPPEFPDVIPPRFGEDPAPKEHAPTDSPITPGWVMDMARLLGYRFVTEEDAGEIASLLAPVKQQLAAARGVLKLDIEPVTRPAGLPW